MKALSLFSGIGGIDLACDWVGIETVAFCEREPFCQKVLAKHWPDKPIYDDVCTLTKERLKADGIIGSGRTIDLIHGGFPCQPHSIAGDRKGRDDEKDLWPDMFRIIREIKPRWVVGENVANFANTELERTCSDMENEGYETQAFIIPACGVGAWHRRKRTFIVAHSSSFRDGVQERKIQARGNITIDSHWWDAEPTLGRVANGVSDRVDRLKSLGNAVVPAQIYPILAGIKQIHDMM